MKKLIILLLSLAVMTVISCSGVVTVDPTKARVKVAMKPDTGDWISSDGLPMWVPNKVKWQLTHTAEFGKYYTAPTYAMGDFDGDGVDDLFMLGMPKQPGVVWDKPTIFETLQLLLTLIMARQL